MQRQSFYDNQAVDNTDLNAISGNAEDADKAIAKEAIGYGITSGMSVIAVGGQMKIGVNSGTLIDKTGQRCTLAGLHEQTITQDTAGTPVAVGAGQERWVGVFAKVGRSLTGYEEESSGGVKDSTNYTVQTPIVNPNGDVVSAAQMLHVVCGAAAAVGSAARPALDSQAILICDLYVAYGQMDYTGTGVINFQRSEMLRRVESDQSDRAQGTVFHLFRQFHRGAKITREYIGASGGMLITVNAEYAASQGTNGVGKWKADDYAQDSHAFALGAGLVGASPTYGIGAFYVAGGTFTEPWAATSWLQFTPS